ncbi:MAG: DUF6194 family protein [bacterium]
MAPGNSITIRCGLLGGNGYIQQRITIRYFTKKNVLMPHPVYAWMSWVCVVSPTVELFEKIYPLIVEAHDNAIQKFNKKVK